MLCVRVAVNVTIFWISQFYHRQKVSEIVWTSSQKLFSAFSDELLKENKIFGLNTNTLNSFNILKGKKMYIEKRAKTNWHYYTPVECYIAFVTQLWMEKNPLLGRSLCFERFSQK